ncbi:MAG TPA: hypothetical protein DCZ94_08940 [Lentisphaeria bacterium]|nr:MAG: hypothetical protein A2X48_23465 [Lentisphaerae bacterium GWF2_49_21]HBC87066.1 hypothetical protein [Lentisphaeria bacterium]
MTEIFTLIAVESQVPRSEGANEEIRIQKPGSAVSNIEKEEKSRGDIHGIKKDERVVLDPPVPASVLSKVQLAFGFDRLVQGYTGRTVRLKRLTDGVEADYGFDGDGYFELDAVKKWAGRGDVSVVYFMDQKKSGKLLLAEVGIAYLIKDGAISRFGCSWDPKTGLLSMMDVGGIGARLENGACLSLQDSGITVESGLEIIPLFSSLLRKGNNVNDPIVRGCDTGEEYYLSYGNKSGSLNYRTMVGGYVFYLNRSNISPAGSISAFPTTGNHPVIKQYGQRVLAFGMSADRLKAYDFGRLQCSKALTDAIIKANTNDKFGNGRLVIGAGITASGEINNLGKARILFGGVIVTSTLADLERFFLMTKLGAAGQQHQLATRSQIEELFDEIVDFRDLDTKTYTVSGKKGKIVFELNTTEPVTYYGRTKYPAWTYDHTIPDIGLHGLNTDDELNYANVFDSKSTYFAGQSTGSIMSVHWRSPKSLGNSLGQWIAQGNGSVLDFKGEQKLCTNCSLALGFDHDGTGMTNLMASSKDGSNLFIGRPFAGTTMVNHTSNRAYAGYDIQLLNNKFTYGEKALGLVWTEQIWLEKLNLRRPVPENIAYPYTNAGNLYLQIGTFQSPAGYDRHGTQAERDALAFKATNYSYISPLMGNAMGHIVGDIACQIEQGSVTDSVDDARIMCSGRLANVNGTRILCGFARRPLSLPEIEKITVNLYKILEK